MKAKTNKNKKTILEDDIDLFDDDIEEEYDDTADDADDIIDENEDVEEAVAEDTDDIVRELREKAAKKAAKSAAAPAAEHRMSSRQAAALRKQQKRKKVLILALCFVGLIVLAVGGYFGANYFMDKAKVDDMTAQLNALSDITAFNSVADLQAAADSAESNYNQLSADLRGKIDTQAIVDARSIVDRVTAMQGKLNAMPTSIAFSEITTQSAAIAALRAEYDALPETDKHLLDETPLVNAEALVISTEAEFQPIVDFNAKIAAFTIVQTPTRENIEAMIAQLNALKAELDAATFDKSYVDTAALAAKETEINALVSTYSTTLTSERTEILALLTTATEKCDSIVRKIKDIEVPEDGSGAVFAMDEIASLCSSYVETMEKVVELVKSSTMFQMVPGYTDGALEAAQNAISKVKAGRSYGDDTVITDSSKLKTFKGYFDSAKEYNSKVATAVNTVKDGVDSFLAGWVTASAATTPADTTEPAADDAAATEGDATSGN